MTAARRPSRAAATATFVGLPPSDFANVRTSASVMPICSGYMSTPTRPIVMTSRLAMLPRVRGAPRDPFRRTRRGLAVQHDVLLEHVPTRVSGLPQLLQHILDPRRALAERAEETSAHRIVVQEAAVAHARAQRFVHILEVHVADARSGVPRDLQRVGAAERDVP